VSGVGTEGDGAEGLGGYHGVYGGPAYAGDEAEDRDEDDWDRMMDGRRCSESDWR
jgi:hypothetical protein